MCEIVERYISFGEMPVEELGDSGFSMEGAAMVLPSSHPRPQGRTRK
jgi:hypothetical protein